jgi:hypothetical protein
MTKSSTLRRLGHAGAFLLAILLGSVSAASADGTDDVHPADDVKRLGAVHQIVQDMDRRSFDRAIAYYPNAEGDPYSVDMSEYLFWKVVTSFRSDARPGRLALAEFSELCTRRQDAIGPGSSVSCNLVLAVTLTTQDGETTTYEARGTVAPGRWFDPTREAYKPTIRVELRGLLDDLVAQLVARLKGGGLPIQ